MYYKYSDAAYWNYFIIFNYKIFWTWKLISKGNFKINKERENRGYPWKKCNILVKLHNAHILVLILGNKRNKWLN